MMGSPRPAGLNMTLDEMDDMSRGGSSSGKIRQYPKHRAQHMAAAAPYNSPRTPFDSAAVANREVGRRVYVGNLSWEVKWMNLKDHMRQAGEVEHCDVLVEASGRSKGCGLVTYRTAEMAREAIRTLTDTELLGRKIFVREDREEGAPPGGNGSSYRPPHHPSHPPPATPTGPMTTSRVYVSNLSWSVKWQELKDFMKQAGPVLHADVLEEPSGRSKGCGIVEYDTPEFAERAIRTLNDTQFGDRKIFIREDREARGLGRPPTGFSRPPPRGYDAPPPRSTYDPSPQSYDALPRGYDAYDPPGRGYDPTPSVLPRGYSAYDPPGPPPRAGGHYDAPGRAPYDAPPGGRGYNSAPPHRGGGPQGYPPGPAPGPAAPGTKLFVGNIPFDASWQDLKDLFRSVANVDHVEVQTTADGRSKGYALVQCSSVADAQAAIGRLHDTDFRGRYLEVRLDRPRFG
ncbi:hypothetical protein Ae201684P_015291 [Aphanomyces euteiches]|nr:hypothetical protein Ae201684P_015291 [Aphanomyces euteiches]